MNPGTSPADVRVTYFLGGGQKPINRTYQVAARTRKTIAVHDTAEGVGRGQEVAMRVESTNGVGIVAERPIYFRYNATIDGGHTTVGASLPRATWYFAEGFTGDGFDQYLTILNPNGAAVPARLTFYLTNGLTRTSELTIDPTSRKTVAVHELIGRGQAVSTKVEALNGAGIVAERPIYFRYGAGLTGGHVALGAAAPMRTWYLAEGYTGAGFDAYLTIQNPNPGPATVRITYYLRAGGPVVRELSVPGTSRVTVAIHDPAQGVGRDQEVAARVESTNGVTIVVERPSYFRYGTTVDGGHNVVGYATN
jgi:hypothetical protein